MFRLLLNSDVQEGTNDGRNKFLKSLRLHYNIPSDPLFSGLDVANGTKADFGNDI